MGTKDNQVCISVVIPTYNYADYLPDAIESALAQTLLPLEVIVADDGSTDNTERVVASYPGVRYIKYRHMGVYSVRASVLDEIQGNWFINLDADNRLDTCFIEFMQAEIERHHADTSFAFAYPDVERIGSGCGRVIRPEFDVTRLKQGNYIDMNAAIRLATARRYPFDPSFNSGQGDYDFFLTLVESGYWGKHVKDALLYYRVHERSITRRLTKARKQVRVTRRLVDKHRKLFNRAEKKAAIEYARNRLLASLINDRSPYAGIKVRLVDWLHFLRFGPRHAELLRETLYMMDAGGFFFNSVPSSDVFFLFRESAARRRAISQLLAGETSGTESVLLFGYDRLQSEFKLQSNLLYPRVEPESLYLRYRFKYDTLGLGAGDYVSLAAHLPLIMKARVVFASSDNTGLPALGFKACNRFSGKLIYTSIGLPERILELQKRNSQQAELFRRRFCQHVDAVVAYGYSEAKWLRDWVNGAVPVHFIAFGVDETYWFPENNRETEWDCICVGADPLRDFAAYLDLAAAHPSWKMKLICSRSNCIEQFGKVPDNIVLEYDVSLDRVKQEMLASKLVVLPVRENTYSGATTTLLQAMALGKAVVVSEVGAIKKGYGLKHGENVTMVQPSARNELSQNVAALLNDESERFRLGHAARKHVSALLTWDRYLNDLCRVVKRLVVLDRTGGPSVEDNA